MKKFRDTNTGEIITEEELRKEFEELKKETDEEDSDDETDDE